MTLYNALFYFFIYAFLGWCLEVAFNKVKRGVWVNRGFLNGPLCPIYGVGVVGITWLVDKSCKIIDLKPASLADLLKGINLDQIWGLFLLFLMITVSTTLLELVTGVLLEKLFMTKWWDYSDNKLNYKGYICLRFSLAWGATGTFVMLVVHSAVVSSVALLGRFQTQLILSAMLTLFVLDLAATIKALINFRKLLFELEKVSEEYNHAKDKLLSELESIIDDLESPAVRIKEELEKINRGMNASKDKLKEEFGKFGGDLNHLRDRLKGQLTALRGSDILPNGAMREFLGKRVDLERRLKKPIQTNIHEIYGRFNKLTNKLSKNRFFRSFPDMKSDKFGSQINAIRSKYNEAKDKMRKK